MIEPDCKSGTRCTRKLTNQRLTPPNTARYSFFILYTYEYYLLLFSFPPPFFFYNYAIHFGIHVLIVLSMSLVTFSPVMILDWLGLLLTRPTSSVRGALLTIGHTEVLALEVNAVFAHLAADRAAVLDSLTANVAELAL